MIFFKSLGPIDCKLHGHGENDGFVLYEYMYIIKQFGRVCKYTNIDVMKKICQIKLQVNSKQKVRIVYGQYSFVSHCFGLVQTKHSS